QQLQVSQNQALFALIGNAYGGSGPNTFNLPNLQGRVPLGVGTMPGGPNFLPGEVGGSLTTTLTVANLPAHIHSATGLQAQTQAWATPATDQNPSTGKGLAAANLPSGLSAQPVRAYADPSGSPVNLAGGAVSGATSPTGGNLPVNNTQPYLALNFCIALSGLYPMRQN
ncbi:MAG: phage tail protein, partial [Salinarimonas sp.]